MDSVDYAGELFDQLDEAGAGDAVVEADGGGCREPGGDEALLTRYLADINSHDTRAPAKEKHKSSMLHRLRNRQVDSDGES